MNRKERRITNHLNKEIAAELPFKFMAIKREDWPPQSQGKQRTGVYINRKYLVQVFDESCPEYPALVRLSICRTTLNSQSKWKDGIAWEDLQAIKSELGYGNWYGLEVYPREADIVNVANFRHLWLLPEPLSIGWFGK